MRHQKKGRKLNRKKEHREALLRNLAREVFLHERIKTTEAKAKEVAPLVENIITLTKKGDLSSRRRVLALLGDRELTHKVFTEMPGRFSERNGGYTRILKLGNRQGDGAPLVFIELV